MKFVTWGDLIRPLSPAHNHFTRDMKMFGVCDACDKSHLVNRVWRYPT